MRGSASEEKSARKTGNGKKAAFLVTGVLAVAGIVFYFGTAAHSAKASETGSAERRSPANKKLSSKSLSLPMFFEPNQGQTAPQVKFLARGSGYGLFLTADEAVLQLQGSAISTHLTPGSQLSAVSSQRTSSSVIRMRLDEVSRSARVSGGQPLPGKSNYFIGNDPAQWRHNIPQFGRVEYKSVYPGVDLVYYGDQGQLEYDFRVAPGADTSQIALDFTGASARILSGDSGDLILSTGNGDVRFHAPRIYQPALPATGNTSGNAEKAVAGSFRQLAENRIGFTIGDYDHNRELVIDPVLSYSTYLGGSGTEGLAKVAVDSAGLIYVAGSTTSTDFPVNIAKTNNPNNPPYQLSLNGKQNIFIAVINPTLVPPQYVDTQQLVYATYLGGSGVDSLAGVAVDSAFGIYVAGTTTSPNFPTTSNAFQTKASFTGTQAHGFLSKIGNTSPTNTLVYGLTYSTYLAGNGTDSVTGLAIDQVQDAYVTGVSTSNNPASDGFPANPNGYQTTSHAAAGVPQFFASKINTTQSGDAGMIYSTYFGGGIFAGQITVMGGGIAVDPPPVSTVNMYITGTTNMLQGAPGVGFPLFNSYQSCLDESGQTSCRKTNQTNPDAFVAKINPNPSGYGANPIYSTYIGGSNSDFGNAIAVDTTGNAYVTGSTNSNDWASTGSGFQTSPGGGLDAFIAKIGNLTGSTYPLNYFTYLGGSGDDIGQDIKVDLIQTAYVTGSTTSTNFPTTLDTYQPTPGGGGDAFVASIGTTLSGQGAGDFSTYLGGSQLDQGSGVAIDIFGATYVVGNTLSPNFPVTSTAFQPKLNSGSQDAFVTQFGASSQLVVTPSTTSPSPSPVAAGTQVAFTFDILNMGPDNASNVNFYAIVPTTGLASSPTAKVTSGSGSCGPVSGNSIFCNIPALTACTQPACTAPVASVEVDLTPSITANNPKVSVSGKASANNGPTQGLVSQSVNVVDFSVSATPPRQTINDGDVATIQVAFCPTSSQGYNATITPTQTTSPTMVTAATPSFSPTSVTLSGSNCANTTLTIATVPRPVNTGSLLHHRGSFYAAWLPVVGLSLVGLGIGAGRKRRRWLAGAVLGLIAGVILLQPGCGSASSPTTTGGGTQAQSYTVTIVGSAGTGASHNYPVVVQVN